MTTSASDARDAALIATGSTTTRLLGTFQGVEHVFVVGVGGAVPHYTDFDRHVRLGDVVISDCTPPSAGDALGEGLIYQGSHPIDYLTFVPRSRSYNYRFQL